MQNKIKPLRYFVMEMKAKSVVSDNSVYECPIIDSFRVLIAYSTSLEKSV